MPVRILSMLDCEFICDTTRCTKPLQSLVEEMLADGCRTVEWRGENVLRVVTRVFPRWAEKHVEFLSTRQISLETESVKEDSLS